MEWAVQRVKEEGLSVLARAHSQAQSMCTEYVREAHAAKWGSVQQVGLREQRAHRVVSHIVAELHLAEAGEARHVEALCLQG